MGIQGLLQVLQPVTRKQHVSAYKGEKVGIDTYCWLHRGAYSCSEELCQNIPTYRHIRYCIKMVQMLLYYEVKPVLVFDGANLPMKEGQEIQRAARREEAKKKAAFLLANGKRSAARDAFAQAVNITPQMAYCLIEELKRLNHPDIEVIVAPYEADAQLAYLGQTGYIHAVITEDSDLIPYGTPRVLYKMSRTGEGEEVELSRLGDMPEPMPFADWSLDMFRHVCILSGCDYLDSLEGIGLKTAYLLYKRCGKDLEKVLRSLNTVLRHKYNVPPDYTDRFQQADYTFRHQRVYDPLSQKLVTLTPLECDDPVLAAFPSLDFLGKDVDPRTATAIALGKIDPTTWEPFQPMPSMAQFEASSSSSASSSFSEDASFTNRGGGQRLKRSRTEPTLQPRNSITNYFAKLTASASASSAAFQRKRPTSSHARSKLPRSSSAPLSSHSKSSVRAVFRSRFFSTADEDAALRPIKRNALSPRVHGLDLRSSYENDDEVDENGEMDDMDDMDDMDEKGHAASHAADQDQRRISSGSSLLAGSTALLAGSTPQRSVSARLSHAPATLASFEAALRPCLSSHDMSSSNSSTLSDTISRINGDESESSVLQSAICASSPETDRRGDEDEDEERSSPPEAAPHTDTRQSEAAVQEPETGSSPRGTVQLGRLLADASPPLISRRAWRTAAAGTHLASAASVLVANLSTTADDDTCPALEPTQHEAQVDYLDSTTRQSTPASERLTQRTAVVRSGFSSLESFSFQAAPTSQPTKFTALS